jgi:hypothetical protein
MAMLVDKRLCRATAADKCRQDVGIEADTDADRMPT